MLVNHKAIDARTRLFVHEAKAEKNEKRKDLVAPIHAAAEWKKHRVAAGATGQKCQTMVVHRCKS